MGEELENSYLPSLNLLSEGAETNTLKLKPPASDGCKHYVRHCLFVSPCCGKLFSCRICHDKVSEHEIDRHAVIKIVCCKCDTQQLVSNRCTNCELVFGKYYCSVCRLYDDNETNKFHCDGCGICRLGKREDYFHCNKCGLCLPVSLLEKHRCIENASRTNCPVCMTDLHTARSSCHIPKCGHLLHSKCYKMLLNSGNYKCPLCGISTLPMEEHWKIIDEEIANTRMPEEYANFKKWILCQDCHFVSEVLFHVLGLKCENCGSYNTCDTKPPNHEGTSV